MFIKTLRVKKILYYRLFACTQLLKHYISLLPTYSTENYPQATHLTCVSPGRCNGGRYNLRPSIIPAAAPPPLAPPISWPGFSSDDGDEDYMPRLDTSQI